MGKPRSTSDVRKLKRGRLKVVFFKTLEKFFKYRLTSRGWWVQVDNLSAPRLTKHQMTKVINDMGGSLQYIKSGSTGHTFKGEYRDAVGNILYEYAVKVVAYSIKDKYGSIYDANQ